MKFKIAICLIVTTLVLGLSACNAPTEKGHDEQLADKLQMALQNAFKNPDTKFPGALLYVSSPEIGTWAGAAGLSNVKTTTAMRPDNRFRAASILKPFISVVILQLMEEGRFSLNDSMTAVLPESVTRIFSESSKIMAGYGLGMMKFLLPGDVEMLGHAGTTGGFQSFIYYLPTQNITVSGIMNNTESNQYQILLPVLEILVPDFASQR